jgi:hypothetical protein
MARVARPSKVSSVLGARRSAAALGLALGLGSVAALAPSASLGQEASRIYTCVDPDGRRISSDRPIPECLSREQRLLGRDGTPRGVVPPLVSREEIERREAQQQELNQAKAVQNEAARHDRMLATRYPDAKAWDAARLRAMAPVQQRIDAAKARLESLAKEATGLARERENLNGKPLPADLRSRISVNEGSTEGQRTVLQNQTEELARINSQFALEKERLDGLWRGMPPGFGDGAESTAEPKPR